MTLVCPLIEIAGAPYERGQSYGRQATERIRKGIAHYAQQLQSLSLTAAELSGLVRDYLPLIEGFDASYVEEMRGIAVGAGVDFENVVLLNARTEILKLARRPDLRARLQASFAQDGCTVVVVEPPATRNRILIHAQNWDWKHECAETVCVLRVRRDDGPDFLTFTEAGALARAGFNAAGIAVTGNYLESDRDYSRPGVPLALIRRKVLEQSHLAMAYQAVYCTQKSCSNNMIVSHRSGLVLDFECAPDETFTLDPVAGLLVHANHFVSPVALTKLQDKGLLTMPDSLYRDRRVRSLLTPRLGDLTVEDIQQALFDDFETPWSVCCPPRATAGGSSLSATVAMIVMLPALGTLNVALLPALNRQFAEFRLEASP
jgi:isopenicillin-N N-acyltransferase-like protein